MASCVRATLENVQFAVLCMFEAGAVHLIPRFFYKAVFPLYFQLRGQIGANKADLPLYFLHSGRFGGNKADFPLCF